MWSLRFPLWGVLLSATAILAQLPSVTVTDVTTHTSSNSNAPVFSDGDLLSIVWSGISPVFESILAVSCPGDPQQITPNCKGAPANVVATFFNVSTCTPPGFLNSRQTGQITTNACTYFRDGSGSANITLESSLFNSSVPHSKFFQIQISSGSEGTSTSDSEFFSYLVSTPAVIGPSSTSIVSSAPSATAGTSPSVSGTGAVPPSVGTPATVTNNGLSTGAKVGIAVGIVGAALIALVVGALLFRRHRRNSRNTPAGTAYSRDLSSQHELQQEKEANLIHSSEGGEIGAAGATNARDSSYEPVGGEGVYDNHAGYTDRGFNGNGITRNDHEGLGAGAAATGAVAGAQAHRRETAGGPFMSVDERQRWDEEEARLDEAIAEAERRR